MYFLESHRSVIFRIPFRPRSGRRAFARIFSDFGEKVAQQAGSFFSNPFFEIKRFFLKNTPQKNKSQKFRITRLGFNFGVPKKDLEYQKKILEYQKKIWSTKKIFWSTKKSSQMRGGRSAAFHGILKITLRWDSKKYTSKQPKTTKNNQKHQKQPKNTSCPPASPPSSRPSKAAYTATRQAGPKRLARPAARTPPHAPGVRMT